MPGHTSSSPADDWRAAADRWLRRSGVPAFVPGHARPLAVLRRWPSVLGIAVMVACGVLVAAVVAGYGATFWSFWPQLGLAVGALAVGVLATVLGLPEIGLFTLRWFARTAWRSGGGMLRVLPILLVALVFTFLSAETWQSIGQLTGTPLVLATLLLVVLALLPLLRSVDDEVRFDDMAAVRAALPAELAADTPGLAAGGGAPPGSASLSLTERVNLRLIGALGRALVAVVVGLAVAVFFCVFGVLTVTDAVTTTWIGGTPDVWWRFTVGQHSYTLTAEHVRVAMFLGVFSALYFVVSASTDRHLADALSADARVHVQQCLAVRAIYRADRVAVASRSPGRGRGRRRRSA